MGVVVSVERLSYEIAKPVRSGQFPSGDKRAETVHRNRPLILNWIAALDMLLLPFLKQIGACGHTNSLGYPRSSVALVAKGGFGG